MVVASAPLAVPASSGNRRPRPKGPSPAQPPGQSKPMPKASGKPPMSNLSSLWEAAFLSSQDQTHRKVEVICCQCHTRTFSNKSDRRECGAPLATSYTLLPRQWPPLGVPQQVLQQFESPAGCGHCASPQRTFSGGSQDPGPGSECSCPAPPVAVAASNPLTRFSRAQLLTEITALEKHLKDTEGTVSAHQHSLQTTLQTYKNELASRKSTGKRLDEAEAKLKASQAATKAAEARVQEAALVASENALTLARRQEKTDTESLTFAGDSFLAHPLQDILHTQLGSSPIHLSGAGFRHGYTCPNSPCV